MDVEALAKALPFHYKPSSRLALFVLVCLWVSADYFSICTNKNEYDMRASALNSLIVILLMAAAYGTYPSINYKRYVEKVAQWIKTTQDISSLPLDVEQRAWPSRKDAFFAQFQFYRKTTLFFVAAALAFIGFALYWRLIFGVHASLVVFYVFLHLTIRTQTVMRAQTSCVVADALLHLKKEKQTHHHAD